MLTRVVALFLTIAAVVPTAHAEHENPALIVFISVDQMRGDFMPKYAHRFTEGGLNRFYKEGAYYANAHYRHSMTATGCGHATLSTGGSPSEHGIVGNSWVDPRTGNRVYCVDDVEQKLVGTTSTGNGISPANLLVNTIGDELVWATNGKSRVFGVSRKDRSAVLMAGLEGKAFWYDSRSGGFMSSTYYYQNLPWWAEEWNKAKHADAYAGRAWDLLQHPSEYLYYGQDDRPVEIGHPLLGKTFPHTLAELEDRALYGVLSYTPFGDELTIEFAKTVIEAEKLGKGSTPDMLALGLSGTDSIGHAYGPFSLEAEDNILRVDAMLAEFFAYLDERFGRDNVLLVLSADHGVDGNPGTLLPPYRASGSLQVGELAQVVKDALKGVPNPPPGIDDMQFMLDAGYAYFPVALLEDYADRIAEFEIAVAHALAKVEGIAFAIPSHRIAQGLVHDTQIMGRVSASYHPLRAGNVFVVQEPYYRFESGAPTMTATHGSPYAYDTHVPVAFAGKRIAKGLRIHRPVGPENIAPTLAAYLGIAQPPGATQAPLEEVARRPLPLPTRRVQPRTQSR